MPGSRGLSLLRPRAARDFNAENNEAAPPRLCGFEVDVAPLSTSRLRGRINFTRSNHPTKLHSGYDDCAASSDAAAGPVNFKVTCWASRDQYGHALLPTTPAPTARSWGRSPIFPIVRAYRRPRAVEGISHVFRQYTRCGCPSTHAEHLQKRRTRCHCDVIARSCTHGHRGWQWQDCPRSCIRGQKAHSRMEQRHVQPRQPSGWHTGARRPPVAWHHFVHCRVAWGEIWHAKDASKHVVLEWSAHAVFQVQTF